MEREETAAHVLLKCTGVAAYRAKYLGARGDLPGMIGNVKGLLGFLEELGWLDDGNIKLFRHKIARVIEGESDFKNEYSFVVPIVQWPLWNRMCSGSIISHHFVLTAGHCIHPVIKEKRTDHLLVVYGNITHQKGLKIAKVIKAIAHPDYMKSIEDARESLYMIKNDIALLYVERFDNTVMIGNLSAVDYMALIGKRVHYIGAGGTYTHYDYRHNKKKVIKIFTNDQIRVLQVGKGVVIRCLALSRPFYPMICLSPKCAKKRQGVQGGDSGGPVIVKNKIAGVCTGVNQLADDRLESLYTPVSPYLDWLHNTMIRYTPQII